MFDQLFTSVRALERYSSGPLLEERLRYLAHALRRGAPGALSVSSRNISYLSSIIGAYKPPTRSLSSRSRRRPICGSAVNPNLTVTM